MKKFVVGTLLAALCAQPLFALDFGADNPRTTPRPDTKGFYAGLVEQDTYFDSGRLDLENSDNTIVREQYLNTLTSQPYLGYNFSDRIGLQLDLPVIYRQYQIAIPGPSFFRARGSTYGIGDIRLSSHFGLVKKQTPDWTINWNATAGIKFPTGDDSQLQNAIPPLRTNSVGPPIIGKSNFGPVEPISGHDLALGSGSYDGFIGTDVLVRAHKFLFTAGTQYAIRSEGAFHYQFANDLSWYGGPGLYLAERGDYTLSLQAIVSGDTKVRDTVNVSGGRIAVPNTGETGVYLGPQINFTWRDRLTAELGADIPVSMVATGVQITPTYRIVAAAVWRF